MRKKGSVQTGGSPRQGALRTQYSAWTPVATSKANGELFAERLELVCHWFDLWTDSQRKAFLNQALQRCRRSQLHYIHQWFREKVPLRHLDFTTVLPRCLSLHIFSMLDPRSLSRTSRVSWHWRFLSEQDDVWRPKCQRLGWFLSYTPGVHEYGDWKRHYIHCWAELRTAADEKAKAKPAFSTGAHGSSTQMVSGETSQRKMKPQKIRETPRRTRPPWQPPSLTPRELKTGELSARAPKPVSRPAVTLSPKQKRKTMGTGTESGGMSVTLSLSRPKHRAIQSGEPLGISSQSQKRNLSEMVALETFEETRLLELVNQPWLPPAAPPVPRRDRALTWRPGSSELLAAAVRADVTLLLYEHSGTTLEGLLHLLDSRLAGRQARSIGVVLPITYSWQLELLSSRTVTQDTVDAPEVRVFFEEMAGKVVAGREGGHVDLFVPLATSEEGQYILKRLNGLTDVTFTTPAAVVGDLKHVSSSWTACVEGAPPPDLYFCPQQYGLWTHLAGCVQETVQATLTSVSQYFKITHRRLIAQVTGAIIQDQVKLVHDAEFNDLTNIIKQGLVDLFYIKKDRKISLLQKFAEHINDICGDYDIKLQQRVSARSVDDTKTFHPIEPVPKETTSARDKSEDLDDQEVEEIIDYRSDIEEDIAESIDEVASQYSQLLKDDTKHVTIKPVSPVGRPPTPPRELDDNTLAALTTARDLQHPVPKRAFAAPGDVRHTVALQLLDTEVQYMTLMDMLRRAYIKPLQAALKANKAILSNSNIFILFGDAGSLLELSRSLVRQLKQRMDSWTPASCLGDVLLDYSGKLQVFVNYVNNHSIVLDTLERCVEQGPEFRAFIETKHVTAQTGMLSLPELLLTPAHHLLHQLAMVTWFNSATPGDHADKGDLETTVDNLTVISKLVTEAKHRVVNDRTIVSLQKTIRNAPALLETNRFFLRQMDVALLRVDTQDDHKLYKHTGNLGLFLFNDALVIAKRTTKHLPFSRAEEQIYVYDKILPLPRLRVNDISDSKYVQHAFELETPRTSLTLRAPSTDDKVTWVLLVEDAVRAVNEDEGRSRSPIKPY